MGFCHRLATLPPDRRREDGQKQRSQFRHLLGEASQARQLVQQTAGGQQVPDTGAERAAFSAVAPVNRTGHGQARKALWRARTGAAARRACRSGRWPLRGRDRGSRRVCGCRSAGRCWNRRVDCRCGPGLALVAWGSAIGSASGEHTDIGGLLACGEGWEIKNILRTYSSGSRCGKHCRVDCGSADDFSRCRVYPDTKSRTRKMWHSASRQMKQMPWYAGWSA